MASADKNLEGPFARAGEPVAVLSPYRPATRRRKLGLFLGQAKIRDDFDELPADIQAEFSGEST
jgi:antitoxin (DNA-binding transcriptional repressor) of toxin-antitoxin stability system